MRAVLVDKAAPANLFFGETEDPATAPSETLIRISAVSLNRGEVTRAQMVEAGFNPGWDLSGTVELPAADGTGPQAGARAVGFLPSGARAEPAAVPMNFLAELPENVSFEQAATLPIAGLTALYALEKGGVCSAAAYSVTGASGGARQSWCSSRVSPARAVVALVGCEEHKELMREAEPTRLPWAKVPGTLKLLARMT